MESLISVIVPVYNVEKYLDRCIESIVSQTYKNLEIILVDDGSPDNCPKMCDEWAKKDDRIIVIHKDNGGVSSARNAALDIATGDYIGFIDSDDYVSKRYFEILINNLKKYDADICCCNFYVTDSYSVIDKSKYKFKICKKNQILINYFKDDFVGPSVHCKIYSSKIIENLRFDTNISIGEDYVFNYYVFNCSNCVLQIDENLYYYNLNENSVTNLTSIDMVMRWKNTKTIIMDINDATLKKQCLTKYAIELVACVKEMLNSDNNSIIDSCYNVTSFEIRKNSLIFLKLDLSIFIKLSIVLISINKTLFKYFYKRIWR